MPTIFVNGVSIAYPDVGDSNWGTDATNFAIQVAAALGKIGQSAFPPTNDITVSPGNLSVSSGNLSVGGTLDVTGATTLSSTLGVIGDVAVNTNKFNVTASSGNTTIAGTLGVFGNTTIDGVTYLDDNTTANTPVISFTGDTDTGIGRSAADTIDFITNGNSRFRIESTGQIKAVYESQVGTDYNTQLDNGYLCRAWVNFNGTLAAASMIRASGNISSITDNGTGDYAINFTSAMPDANYTTLITQNIEDGSTTSQFIGVKTSSNSSYSTKTTSAVAITVRNPIGSNFDPFDVNVGIFR